MNRLTPMIASMSALLIFAPGAESQQAGRGRTAPQSAESPDASTEIMRVIALKNASSASVAHMLSELGFEIVSDGSTNSIIVNGTLEKLQTLEELITKLDIPAGGLVNENLAVIPVRHRPPQELANHIMVLGQVRNARVASDTARSMILINGPDDVLDMARQITEALDTPARSVALDFAFFQAIVGGADPVGSVPHDLAAVAKELDRFGAVQLLGRMGTSCVEGEGFEIMGELKSHFVCEVNGELIAALDGGSIKLRLQARLGLESRADEPGLDGQVKRAVFEVETTVVTQSGDIVVLGSAPAGLEEGQSVILVLRVRDNAPA
jgi:hypothetical protein